MRDLNEILTRNAIQFMREAMEVEAKHGHKLSQHQIAGRMAAVMGMKHNTVQQQLKRILAGKADWTAPYIHGLALALGKTPQELVSLDPKSERVPDATIAAMLYTGLNHRLTLGETRRLIRRLHRQLDHPPTRALIENIVDAVLDAPAKEQAFEATMDLLRKSTAWERKRPDLRGKKKLDRSS